MRQTLHGQAALITAALVSLAASETFAQSINLQFNGSGNTLAATGFDSVYNIDPTGFNVAGGKLTLQTTPGDIFGEYELDPGDSAKNVFYMNVATPPTRTVLEAKITVTDLNVNFHGGGIWMGTDTDHYLRLGVINNTFEGGADVEGLRENEDLWTDGHGGPGNDIQGVHKGLGIVTNPQDGPLEIGLRIIRDGTGATMFTTLDNGTTWTRHPAPSTGFTFDNMVTGAGQGWGGGSSIEGGYKVGVYALGGPDGQIPANFAFDYLTATGGLDSWALAGNGTWDNDSSWTLLTPSGVDATANFGTMATSNAQVTVNGDHNVGTIIFNNANGYNITGNGTVTLNAFTKYSGTTTLDGQVGINVVNGNHTISSNLVLQKALTVNVANATNTLTVTNGLAGVGTFLTLTKSGAGTLVTKNLNFEAAVSVTGGTITVAANGTPSSLSRATSLSITGGGALDLTNNDLILTATDYPTVRNLVASARTGGTWSGSGLTSSTARDASPRVTGLGVVTGAQYHASNGSGALFDGVAVADTDIVIKYTYNGDTGLNGKVDGADYARIDSNFNMQASVGNIGGWFNGDFDYNNKVDGADYALIDAAFNAQGGTLLRMMTYLDGTDGNLTTMNTPALQEVVEHFGQFGGSYAAAALTSVPEPTMLGSIAGIATLAGMRRRRSSSR